MMKNRIIILTLLVLCVLAAVPANAETLSGTVTITETHSDNYVGSFTGANVNLFKQLYVTNIEQTQGTSAFIHFDDSGHLTTYSNPDPTIFSNQTTFVGKIGAVIVCSGVVGYQRLYNLAGVEQPGYQYLLFTTWNVGAYTGNKFITLTYDLDSMSNTAKGALVGAPAGSLSFYGAAGDMTGSYTVNSAWTTINDWTAIKPDGLGISGSVIKKLGIYTYNSRVFIVNATDGSVITSEGTSGNNTYTFNVFPETIYIGIQSPRGVWGNTTNLFETYTPSGVLPAGYVRTYAQNVDGKSGGSIHYSNLQLNDVENSSWTNYTSDFDATGYIDTLPGHTLNFYGDATGYVSTSRLGLSPFDGIYELIMWSTTAFPSAGLNNVNLIVIVNDVRTATPLYNANVIVTVPSGTTTGAKTNSAGSVTFVVPNKSVVHVTADYSGYISGTEVITTSDWGPDTLRIEIGKATVTPTITATPLPGELTARPTLDTRTGAQKDSAMMDLIRNNGEALIGLAICVTFIGLLGLMTKSIK